MSVYITNDPNDPGVRRLAGSMIGSSHQLIALLQDQALIGQMLAAIYAIPTLPPWTPERGASPFTTERERASSVDRMLRPNLVSGRWGHHHIDYLGEAGYFSADEIVENMMRMEEPE